LRSYTDGGQHYPGQLGSEATPAEFLDALLAATREMMRVLKPTGSIFVNLGDRYTGGGGQWDNDERPDQHKRRAASGSIGTGGKTYGLRPKSLIGVPWRYALACIDQLGLILRAEIVLDKRNGLPESVTDRVRRSHEQVFHFTKQPRYYSAVDEIREPHADRRDLRGTRDRADYQWNRDPGGLTRQWEPKGEREYNQLGKLPGSVWEYVSEPLQVPDHLGVDHFAAFATALPRRIIRGWSPVGICLECGQGRRPVASKAYDVLATRSALSMAHRSGEPLAKTRMYDQTMASRTTITGSVCACCPHTDHEGTDGRNREGQAYAQETGRDAHPHGGVGMLPRTGPWREYHFDRWTPAPTRPSVILDPFSGTGTVALVASMLGRIGIGVDLSHDYCRLGVWRTTDPGERARALQVPKPPPVPQGQSAFDFEDVS